MAKSVHISISDEGKFLKQRYKNAVEKGFLEPVIDREGNITVPNEKRKFNHKHETALRRIYDRPSKCYSLDYILYLANRSLLGIWES